MATEEPPPDEERGSIGTDEVISKEEVSHTGEISLPGINEAIAERALDQGIAPPRVAAMSPAPKALDTGPTKEDDGAVVGSVELGTSETKWRQTKWASVYAALDQLIESNWSTISFIVWVGASNANALRVAIRKYLIAKDYAPEKIRIDKKDAPPLRVLVVLPDEEP